MKMLHFIVCCARALRSAPLARYALLQIIQAVFIFHLLSNYHHIFHGNEVIDVEITREIAHQKKKKKKLQQSC